MSSIGLRYERLLFWAAPITLAAFAVFIATLGYNRQQDRSDAACYESAARTILEKIDVFDSKWRDIKLSENQTALLSQELISYERDIALALIYKIPTECWSIIKTQRDDLSQSPKKIVESFSVKSEAFRKNPITLYGIEIPETANISILGTSIKIAMATFIQALQVSLAPVMLLWLGSLYHTRLREAISLGKTDNILSVYPHVINVFPTIEYRPLRKPNFWKFHAPTFMAIFHFLIRASLLLVFAGPSIALYMYSLIYQPILNSWALNIFIGFWVGVYGFGLIFVEVAFGKKHFPGITLNT
ncbi:hypothetical protein [Pseudomonas fluorescens]